MYRWTVTLLFASALVAGVGESRVRATPRGPSSQNLNGYQRQIIGQLDRSPILNRYLKSGFVLQENSALLGYLGRNRREDRGMFFDTGFQDLIIAKCDEDCDDMDMALYDPDGRLVAKDEEQDDTPVIVFIPRVRGTYTLRVSMPGCSAPIGCHWGSIVAASR